MRDRPQRRPNRLDPVAVAHPHLMLPARESLEQFIVLVDHQRRAAKLARMRSHAARAQMLRDHVQAIADSEHRASEVQDFVGNIRRLVFVEARGSARQDDPARVHRADFFHREIERMNFAIHLRLAHAARD